MYYTYIIYSCFQVFVPRNIQRNRPFQTAQDCDDKEDILRSPVASHDFFIITQFKKVTILENTQ